MVKAFEAFIRQHALFEKQDQVLLACSGGIDSTVMATLFQESGYSFGIAHVNFQLRGAESEGDADFLARLAARLGVPFHLVVENAMQGAATGESIQMAARRIRYAAMESIRENEGYHYLATAHHSDDAIETFFLNFAKGSGLSGLTGIPVKRDRIVRPLLFASRQEVEAFARDRGLEWREDRTNREDKYDRNKIRRHLIPVLTRVNPAFSRTAAENLAHLQEARALFLEAVANWRGRCVTEGSGSVEIDLSPIQDHPARATLLYEWLHPFGFHPDQVYQALQGTRHAGATFSSPDHELLVDRTKWKVRPKNPATPGDFVFPANQHSLALPDGFLRKEVLSVPPPSLQTDNWSVYLDRDQVSFPLTVRRWQAGDSFQPFGMGGRHQKLQDFFTHLKLDRWEKEKVWIVESANGDICWVVGHRVDHRFRVGPGTKSYLHLSFRKAIAEPNA